MKYAQFILVPAFILVYCSCHKTSASAGGGNGYWYIFGQQHTVTYTTRKDTAGMILLTAGDTLPTAAKPFVSTISILFGSLPADSAEFQVISPAFTYSFGGVPDINFQLSANQLCVFGTAIINIDSFPGFPDSCVDNIFIGSPWATRLIWPLPPVGQADVSVNNGKIRVILPTEVVEGLNRCGNDSPTVYGYIQEK